jgi:hypothetical protein
MGGGHHERNATGAAPRPHPLTVAAPTLIIFLGGFGSSEAEAVVDGARVTTTIGATVSWALLGGLPAPVLVTSEPVETTGVVIDRDAGEYHFGRRLAGILRKYGVESAVYMGGGSMPLFEPDDFRDVITRMQDGKVVTNNSFSSDLVAFPVNGTTLAAIEPVTRDNSLARALLGAGLQMETLPRTVATQFDIDTPADVAVLALTSPAWESVSLQGRLDGLVARYRATLPLFLDQAKQLVIAGRVGSHAWGYLERETACRVRLFAEERGMEADNRAEKGAARSLLGYYYDAAGQDRFFHTLAELGDAAFIDTRVLLAHRRIDASREDRFLSDLGRWHQISDPFLREFTRGAGEARIPVLLGGHSLMSGGLMALNEYAWRLRDEGKL